MENRPKIKLELTAADRLLEILGWLALLLLWGITILNFSSLPDTIPTHYNALGEADGFGSKNSIWSIPIIATIFFIGLTLLNKYPHKFNYPKEITSENAQKQYSNATRLMRYVKFIIVLIFGMMVVPSVQFPNDNPGLGVWFLPVSMGLLFIPIIFFVIRSYRET